MAKPKKEPDELTSLREQHAEADSAGDYERMARVEQQIRDVEARGYATGGVVVAPPVELESVSDTGEGGGS